MKAISLAVLVAASAAEAGSLARNPVAVSAGLGAGYGLAGVRLEAPVFELASGTLSPYVALMPGRFDFDGTEPFHRYGAVGVRWAGDRSFAPVLALNVAASLPANQAMVSLSGGFRLRLGPAFLEAGAGPAALRLSRSASFGSGVRPHFDVDLGLGVELSPPARRVGTRR